MYYVHTTESNADCLALTLLPYLSPSLLQKGWLPFYFKSRYLQSYVSHHPHDFLKGTISFLKSYNYSWRCYRRKYLLEATRSAKQPCYKPVEPIFTKFDPRKYTWQEHGKVLPYWPHSSDDVWWCITSLLISSHINEHQEHIRPANPHQSFGLSCLE